MIAGGYHYRWSGNKGGEGRGGNEKCTLVHFINTFFNCSLMHMVYYKQIQITSIKISVKIGIEIKM